MGDGSTETGRASPALARGALLLAGCLAGGRGAWLLVREPLEPLASRLADEGWRGVAALGFSDALVAAMAVVLLGCGGWLLATTALTAVAGILRAGASAHRLAGIADRLDRWSPKLVRRLVAAVLGAAVTAGTGPALAAPGGPGAIDGLPLPDRVVGVGSVAAPTVTVRATAPRDVVATGRGTTPDRVVVVQSGDSLWAIAAGLLPAHATDLRVDRAWHRLYLANRSRIGPDPDLVLPGERLTVPDLTIPDRPDRPDRKVAQ